MFSLEGEEADIIQRFYDGIEKFVPQLVSWNGGGFDLPVLNYRALIHGVAAPMFWETGDENRDFRYNNYVSRYHARHIDLMDVLAMYQPRNNAPLDEVAQLAGLPGKIGVGGAKVWETWLAGRGRRRSATTARPTPPTPTCCSCATSCSEGFFSKDVYQKEMKILKKYLQDQDKPHWREFLKLWNDS